MMEKLPVLLPNASSWDVRHLFLPLLSPRRREKTARLREFGQCAEAKTMGIVGAAEVPVKQSANEAQS
ncbi:unnamed protein product [Nippostrongylus brasiliensis]|uniref:Uncharacterized protein n=1 Tax=Nippostrongylus brasiliensis TaxID=27835 RepID=A0A0N4Y941_NIPBR|nr:unnamed protein product [Nippostrongylus brasiliensis]